MEKNNKKGCYCEVLAEAISFDAEKMQSITNPTHTHHITSHHITSHHILAQT